MFRRQFLRSAMSQQSYNISRILYVLCDSDFELVLMIIIRYPLSYNYYKICSQHLDLRLMVAYRSYDNYKIFRDLIIVVRLNLTLQYLIPEYVFTDVRSQNSMQRYRRSPRPDAVRPAARATRSARAGHIDVVMQVCCVHVDYVLTWV